MQLIDSCCSLLEGIRHSLVEHLRGMVCLQCGRGFSYNCLKAGHKALTAWLSLLIRCYLSKDVLESSNVVEVCECVANSLGMVNNFLLMMRMR